MSLTTYAAADLAAGNTQPGPRCWFCGLPPDLRAEVDEALRTKTATHRQVVLFLHAVSRGEDRPSVPLPKGFDATALAGATKSKIETHTRGYHHLAGKPTS
jgi:hypothetical protein